MKVGAFMALCVLVSSGCEGGGSHYSHRDEFGQSAVISTGDNMGGLFDGARLSSGFGILYLSGYTPDRGLTEECGAWLGGDAEHVLEVAGILDLKLVMLQADTPVMFALKGPDGTVMCSEIPTPANANVSLSRRLTAGRYQVWVGAQTEGTSSGYRLVLSE